MGTRIAIVSALGLVSLLVFAFFHNRSRTDTAPTTSFAVLREGFRTTIDGPGKPSEAPATPLAPRLERVRYPGPLGDYWAYVSPVHGAARAGVVYVPGGFSSALTPDFALGGPFENDQSGGELERHDLVVMIPTFRGAHDNPGHDECLFGEVDDVLAAAAYLRSRTDVDPKRIYLVGHSTGGTLVLMSSLVASAGLESERPRGVFALGPTGAVDDYGAACLPPSASVAERRVRSMRAHAAEIKIPTLLVEGAGGNASAVHEIVSSAGRAPVSGLVIPGHDHFTIVAPAVRVIGDLIARDTGSEVNLDLKKAAVKRAWSEGPRRLCGLHRAEAPTPTPASAEFLGKPPGHWPVIVLTNAATFDGHTALQGASAFLMRRPGSTDVWLATALHLVGPAGDVEPELITSAAFAPDAFNAALKGWVAHPRTRPAQLVAARDLADPATVGDWLLLSTDPSVPLPATVLDLASRPVAIGESIYLVGCPYEEQNCVQNIYNGKVTSRTNTHFRYSLDPHVRVQGFSGGPVLNSEGHVVGVFSVSSPIAEDAQGRQIEAEADDTLLTQVAECRSSRPTSAAPSRDAD